MIMGAYPPINLMQLNAFLKNVQCQFYNTVKLRFLNFELVYVCAYANREFERKNRQWSLETTLSSLGKKVLNVEVSNSSISKSASIHKAAMTMFGFGV